MSAIPPDRLLCPRCGGAGHLDPAEIRGACRGTWWDVTVDPPVERACGQKIPDHERQAARLAELATGREPAR